MKFTKEQIENWKSFNRVREGGHYNMFDPNARFSAGLEKEEYMFCMKNFSELKEEIKK